MAKDNVWYGIGLALAPHLATLLAWGVFLLVGADDPFGMVLFFVAAPSLAQLLWVVPGIVWFTRSARPRARAGLLGTAAVVFLLNAACFGLVMASLSMGH